MKKIPNMISTKDLAYISDIFNWNNTQVKKLDYYIKICKDEDICKEFTKLKKIHIQNCKNLINILESCDQFE